MDYKQETLAYFDMIKARLEYDFVPKVELEEAKAKIEMLEKELQSFREEKDKPRLKYKHICQYCGKEFEGQKGAKFCSGNCKTKNHYHKTHLDSKKYETDKSDEQKRLEHNAYFREYYKKHTEYYKTKRREQYKRTGK